MRKTYTFKSRVWLYSGEAAWHFVTLPKDTAEDIDEFFAHVKRGWGSLPVFVTVGKTTWRTSIFPDKKEQSYILPLKALVRRQENMQIGDTVPFTLTLEI